MHVTLFQPMDREKRRKETKKETKNESMKQGKLNIQIRRRDEERKTVI